METTPAVRDKRTGVKAASKLAAMVRIVAMPPMVTIKPAVIVMGVVPRPIETERNRRPPVVVPIIIRIIRVVTWIRCIAVVRVAVIVSWIRVLRSVRIVGRNGGRIRRGSRRRDTDSSLGAVTQQRLKDIRGSAPISQGYELSRRRMIRRR